MREAIAAGEFRPSPRARWGRAVAPCLMAGRALRAAPRAGGSGGGGGVRHRRGGGRAVLRPAAGRARDRDALLERGTVAGGASGRNGGFLLAGVAAFHNDARDLYGRERNRRIYARTVSAQEEVYELAEELGLGDAVRRVGSLRVAVTEEEAERVRGQVQALRDDGFPGELIERDELPPVLQRRGLCACLVDHDAALHPARWYRALAEAAERAGARICEGPRTRAGAGPARGRSRPTAARCERDTWCSRRRALPVLVAEYKERSLAAAAHGGHGADRAVSSTWSIRAGYEYFQQRPDGRLLLAASPPRRRASYTIARRQPAGVGPLESYCATSRPRHKVSPAGGHRRIHRGPAALRAGAGRPGRTWPVATAATQPPGLRGRAGIADVIAGQRARSRSLGGPLVQMETVRRTGSKYHRRADLAAGGARRAFTAERRARVRALDSRRGAGRDSRRGHVSTWSGPSSSTSRTPVLPPSHSALLARVLSMSRAARRSAAQRRWRPAPSRECRPRSRPAGRWPRHHRASTVAREMDASGGVRCRGRRARLGRGGSK